MNEKINLMRAKLDILDREISSKLVERFKLTSEIGRIKVENGIEINQPNREHEVFQQIIENIQCREFEDAIIGVYKVIMEQSKILQSEE